MFEPARVDHLLINDSSVYQSMAVWLRRRQDFGGDWSAGFQSQWPDLPLGDAGVGGAILSAAWAPKRLDDYGGVAMSWGMFGSGPDRLEFAFNARAGGTAILFHVGNVVLPLDEWVLVVWNRAQQHVSGSSPPDDEMEVWANAVRRDTLNPTYTNVSGGSYSYIPANLSWDRAVYVGIGDVCMGSQFSVRGVADGPVVDMSELMFFNQKLTENDQMLMIETMRYGS